MKKESVLILYSLPSPFLPDGTPYTVGAESVLSRLAAVEKALVHLGYPVQTLEAKGDLLPILEKIQVAGADIVFNLCEEFNGQTLMEMNIAAALEILEIPFTGSSALTLGLSQDKAKTKSILAYHGISTPTHRVWVPGKSESFPGLDFPLIVKPLREDASLGIDQDAFVGDASALKRQIHKLFRDYRQPVLVEQYVDGREFNVSILGNEKPQILPISEIDFSKMPPDLPRICSYAAKWMEGSPEFRFTIPRCPASLTPEEEKRIQEVSLLAYQIMECRDYARVDIRMNGEGTPYILEINANPDISRDAGMTRSAKKAGFSYPEFIGKILEDALFRMPTNPAREKLPPLGPERESCD
jgi:D-alanine-D-alanine ligase